MGHAEGDYHLEYLSDFEEWRHPFFNACRMQSAASLGAGFQFLMHGLFLMDKLFIMDWIYEKITGIKEEKDVETITSS